jgi:hypothetical protein
MIIGLIAFLVLAIGFLTFVIIRQRHNPLQLNPEDTNISTGMGVEGLNLVDIGYPYHTQGTCTICGLKRVFVLNVPSDDFVARYNQLYSENNWICTKCWVNAKTHDPQQKEKQLNR